MRRCPGRLGGFSTVWGAQIMPFSRATFDRWPFGWDEIEPHYRAVLAEVPLAAEEDDYAEDFPLLSARAPLPPVSARTAAVLERYRRHRDAIRAQGHRGRQGAAGVGCELLHALRPVHDRLPVLVDLLRAADCRPLRRRRSGAADLARAGHRASTSLSATSRRFTASTSRPDARCASMPTACSWAPVGSAARGSRSTR